jgi:hypothetical protein
VMRCELIRSHTFADGKQAGWEVGALLGRVALVQYSFAIASAQMFN